MSKLTMDGDVNRVFDQLQHQNAVREKDQRQRRQAAEIELLDGTTYREYRARRYAQRRLVAQPKLPLDEMSYRDYRVARQYDLTGAPDEPVVLREGVVEEPWSAEVSE